MGDMLQNLDKVCESKRGKAGNSCMNTRVWCLVDGCTADLSQCRRDYHRRHKVCEPHSKKPSVVVGGVYQRFCQKCSRFHTLGEFDKEKRSCRKRLDGHNRRRRKPQLDSQATAEETHELGTKISSHDSLRLNHMGFDQAKSAKPENSIAPFDDQRIHVPLNYISKHNLDGESSSWFTVSKGGFNHFRFFPCEPLLAADNANHALSLLPLQPLKPSQQTRVGLDHYDFMQEVDNTVVFCDSNGLDQVMFDE